MGRGTPLTPEELTTLVDLYQECGNASRVARELHLSTSTVTRQLAQLDEQRRATLQGGALLTGLIDGRERIDRAVRGVSKKLWAALKTPPPGTPTNSPLWDTGAQDLQQLGSTLARLVTVQAVLDRREEQRQQAALVRDKTRAEITAIEKRVDELPPMATLKAKLSPEQVLELMRALSNEQLDAVRSRTRAKEVPAQEG